MSTRRNQAIDINSNGLYGKFNRDTPELNINEDNSYLYTFGREYTTIHGDEWIGEYHIRKGGFAYTGPVQSKKQRDDAVMLLPYYESMNNFTYDRLFNFVAPLKDHADPVPYEFNVLEEQGGYEQGFVMRYFIQRIGTGNYAMEIDQVQRDKYASRDGIDNRIYRLADVPWRLTGTLAAIEQANKEAVTKGRLLVPDLPYVIRDYTQFARPTAQTDFGMLDAHLINRQTNIGPQQTAPGMFKESKLININAPTPLRATYDPVTGTITDRPQTPPSENKTNMSPEATGFRANTYGGINFVNSETATPPG